tara:strand:- start:43 stop:342 length:300 start_codon:yes stop_codon:yes gene_type:complete
MSGVPSKMKHIIHVHQQKVKKGEPAIIDRTYKGSTHLTRIKIDGPCEIIHSQTPDHCGARVWIETQGPVTHIASDWGMTETIGGVVERAYTGDLKSPDS